MSTEAEWATRPREGDGLTKYSTEEEARAATAEGDVILLTRDAARPIFWREANR